MTKLLKGLYVVGVAALLTASATSSQAGDLKAAVPFAFTVNNHTLAAGIYDVSISQNIVAVRGARDGAFVLGNRAESTSASRSRLVFEKIGDEYVLREVWEGSAGRRMASPRREPRRRGEVAANVERVEVPLL